MEKHEVFVLKDKGYSDIIAFIPTLRKAYLVAGENEFEIPEFVNADGLDKSQSLLQPLKFDRATIVITKNCNLGCIYCYENASPLFLPRNLMDWQIAKAAIDYVFWSTLEKTKVSKDNSCLINFFGGEPTTAWDILQKSIEYARIKSEKLNLSLRITLSTNGFFTDGKLGYLLDTVDAFNLSIDGPKKIHDSLRPTARGKSSFEKVFETAKNIYRKNPEKLLLRTTISQKSVHRMTEIAEFFSENFPGVTQAYEPLQENGRAIDNIMKGPTIKLFLEQVLNIIPIIEARGGKIKISMLDLGNLGNSFCGVNGSN